REPNNCGDLPRYISICLVCDHVLKDHLTGDVAELGVYKGNTAVLLAELARKLGSTAYLFDTFEGFAPNDLSGIDADKQFEFGDFSLEDVRSNIGNDNVRYVKGYFPDSASVYRTI